MNKFENTEFRCILTFELLESRKRIISNLFEESANFYVTNHIEVKRTENYSKDFQKILLRLGTF